MLQTISEYRFFVSDVQSFAWWTCIPVSNFPCIAEQNATQNVSIATQKIGFAIQH